MFSSVDLNYYGIEKKLILHWHNMVQYYLAVQYVFYGILYFICTVVDGCG